MARASQATQPALSRESIVDAAVELFDAEGFEAITMRALADRLGVGAMTLYGYFRTKEELLAALADRALADVELPSKRLGWQKRIAEVFRSVRRTFLEHPELAQIAATQPIDGRSAYRGAEVVFTALEEAGLSDERAVSAFDALAAYTTGFVLRETARGSRSTHIRQELEWIRGLPADEYGHVVRVAGLLAARDSDRHFDEGLEAMIKGFGA